LLTNKAAVHYFEFANFDTLLIDRSWNQTAAAHQISLKSDDPQLRYSDETISKMAVVRHLEFSNFGILVT